VVGESDKELKGWKMITNNKVSVEETLRKLVAKATKNESVVITRECTFKDLGVDSLEVVHILVALEDKLEIDINDKDLASIHNMKAFIDYLEEKVARKNSKK
jgi:acyl carrier protein